jgi:RNA polymerase sigma factor (sigma-70 family)
MPKNALSDVLQSLRILLAPPGQPGTDADLLARFFAGDEGSFAALVHRHGRMVLGVCRRVLGNEHDAEDACQATFLILAQKVRTICKRESLGSWLHGVAFRVSSDLRRKLHRHAMQPLPPEVSGAEQGAVRVLEWQELFQALDEELALLPDRYRTPLVLCYLEGLTRDEAATRLGWSLNGFRGRLERGREMLRRRFCRRGLTLPVAILATGLVETAAQAAVPAYLIVRTVKSALLVTRGVAPATLGLPELVGEILLKGTTMGTPASVFALSLKKALLLLTLGAALVTGGSVLYRTCFGPSRDASWAADQPLETLAPEDMVELSGRVLDPDGRPAIGAKLHIVSTFRSGFGDGTPRGTTGPDGMFRISVPRAALALHLAADQPVSILATSPGLGMAWSAASSCLTKNNPTGSPIPELRLVKDDVPLHGQVETPEGMPIAGAKVSLEAVWANAKDDLTSWVEAINQNKNFSDARQHVPNELTGPGLAQMLSVRTDRTGQFRLPGIGRSRVVVLRITGPALAAVTVLARTEPGARLNVNSLGNFFWPQALGCFGSEIVLSATPSRPIVGTIRDLDTGKPIAGAVVQSHQFAGSHIQGTDTLQTHTDAAGYYQLDGMPIGTGNMVLVRTPPDVAYLPSAVTVDTSRGEGPVTCDIQVKHGIWAVGRVLDADTGRPLSANIDYYCLPTNPHAAEAPGFTFAYAAGALYHTEDDGRFRVPVLAGPGVLAARLQGKEIYVPVPGSHMQRALFHRTFQGNRSYAFLEGQIAGVPQSEQYRQGFYQALPMGLFPGNYNAAAVLDVDASVASVTCDLRVGAPAVKGGKP